MSLLVPLCPTCHVVSGSRDRRGVGNFLAGDSTACDRESRVKGYAQLYKVPFTTWLGHATWRMWYIVTVTVAVVVNVTACVAVAVTVAVDVTVNGPALTVISRLRDFTISRFRDFAIPRFRDFTIPRFRDSAISRFHDFRDFAIPVSRFRDFDFAISRTVWADQGYAPVPCDPRSTEILV